MTEALTSDKKTPGSQLIVFLIVIAIIVAILFAVGQLPRIQQAAELKKAHAQTVDAVPVIQAIVAKPAAGTESITLPANIGAMQYTTIYARVDGYLTSRLVDIGDHVKTGQLLAEIDTPTVDQELYQARADLLEARAKQKSAEAQLKESIAQQGKAAAEVDRWKANNDYADLTAKRWKNLAFRGAVSQQSKDEKVRGYEATTADLNAAKMELNAATAQIAASQSNVGVAKAGVVAKQAAVDREAAKQSFKFVRAPFEGVITERKVDPGALITQGSSSQSLELYQLAKIEKLRVYVGVPQRIARYLHAGMKADVLVPEYPERKFLGEVTNVSGALDPNTRTRQTEIHISNTDHALLPGMYAEVKMTTLRDSQWIRVPGTTIVTKPEGLFVVVVVDGKAHYQPVTVGRDFGDEIEIRFGLKGGEQVVVSPSDDLREGDRVEIGALKSEQL
jgi:membrane fusion protein, multidrug efflux system